MCLYTCIRYVVLYREGGPRTARAGQVALDTEVPYKGFQLGDEERQREKVYWLLVHVRGVSSAELVVQGDRKAVHLLQIGVAGACTNRIDQARRSESQGAEIRT